MLREVRVTLKLTPSLMSLPLNNEQSMSMLSECERT